MKNRFMLGLGLLLMAACGSTLEGELTVDGVALTWDRCESLAPKGFDGVDLVSREERTIRLLRQGTAVVGVGFFEPEVAVGSNLGGCASGEISDTNEEINGVRVLEGYADIDCTATVRLEGSVKFSGCH